MGYPPSANNRLSRKSTVAGDWPLALHSLAFANVAAGGRNSQVCACVSCCFRGFGLVAGFLGKTYFSWASGHLAAGSNQFSQHVSVSALLNQSDFDGWSDRFLYKADQSNHRKYAVYAGLCGLVLGNIHTYDILTLSLVWVAYLVYRTITRRGDLKRIWLNGLLAGLIAAPSTAYVALMLKTETVFRERAEVLTLTPSPLLYLQGFGLLVPLALTGWLTWKRRQSEAHSDQSATDSGSGLYLLGIWTIFNFAAAYIPTTFQRKMMMGVHIPLSILAGVALWNCSRGLSGRVRIAVVGMVLCLLSLTNVRFLLRDMDALPLNQPGVRSYLYRGEMASLQWIREHAAPGDAIQPLPWIAADERGGVGFFDTSVACYAPGITGHAVNAGHWGETPQFGKTMNKWVKFIRPDTDDAYRRELVQQTGVKYILFSQKHQETPNTTLEEATLATMRLHPPAFLRLVTEASNEDTDVYEVSS